MFSSIYPEFHQAYPEITFRIYEARIKRMEQLLERRQVSIALMGYTGKPNPLFEYNYLSKEYIVLALPASHPLAYLAGERSWETFPPMDLLLLKDDVFAMVAKTTRLRGMIDDSFRAAGFSPKVLFESSSTATLVNMVKNQVCPAFFPQSYVDPEAPMVYFSTNPRQSWMQTVAYLKGEYLTKPEKYFIQLVKEYSGGQP